MSIYVVIGRTGEYADSKHWIVAAFHNEKKAQELVEKATRRAKAIKKKWDSGVALNPDKNQFDPFMAMDYTGTWYDYQETELSDQSNW